MREAGTAAPFHRELTTFLSLHRNRGPGVLWPEHDHPACRPQAGPADLDLLADGLTLLTGRPVHTAAIRAGAGTFHAGPTAAHTLVHQTEGGGQWTLHPVDPARTADAFRWRLRAGEVLYIPPQRAWTAEFTRNAGYLLITLGTLRGQVPDRTDPEVRPP